MNMHHERASEQQRDDLDAAAGVGTGALLGLAAWVVIIGGVLLWLYS